MKKIFFFTAIAGFALVNMGCGKETVTTGPPSEEVVNATVASDAVYTYNLGTYGAGRTPVIVKQPSAYQLSRIDVTEGRNALYLYQPQKGFLGEDEVLIQTTRESNGVDPARMVQVRIRFVVKEPQQD